MTTEQPQNELAIEPTNPYKRALELICVLALLLAGILAAIGSSQSDSDGKTVVFVWAGLLSNIGVGCGLLWLLVGALTWKPSKSG